MVKKYPIGPIKPTRCVEHLKENVKVRIPKYVDSSDEDRTKQCIRTRNKG